MTSNQTPHNKTETQGKSHYLVSGAECESCKRPFYEQDGIVNGKHWPECPPTYGPHNLPQPDPRNNNAGCSACNNGTCPGRDKIPHPFRYSHGEKDGAPHPYEILTHCPICRAEWKDGDHEDMYFACGTSYNTEGSGYMRFCDRPGGFR